jgi:hypothetical protein
VPSQCKKRKMKKIILAFSLNIIALALSGQQNPVQNLQANWWYVNPHNCFTLSWDPPTTSITDTLIGYNVYRNDSLYAFTTNTNIHCVPCIGDTTSTYCSFMSYQSSFYTHVTAIYNTSHIESTYNDSAYFIGALATGIQKDIDENKLEIIPNPFSSSTTIRSTKNFNNAVLTIFNSYGQQVQKLSDISGQTITLLRDNLQEGIYFLQLTQPDKKSTTVKLIITDN